MYNKVSTNMNFVEREKEIEKFWRDNDIFRKSMENRKEGETYTFYDGPPTANGKPHIGHVLTRVIKDMIPRYKTMKGYKVPRKAGWDTHGLPVELEVEKALGLDGKEQIEKYGVEPKNVAKEMKNTDKKRAKFHNFYSEEKWGEATTYDLAINVAKLGIDGTVDLISEYIKAQG